MAGQQY